MSTSLSLDDIKKEVEEEASTRSAVLERLKAALMNIEKIAESERNLLEQKNALELEKIVRFIGDENQFSDELKQIEQSLENIEHELDQVEVPSIQLDQFHDEEAFEKLRQQLENIDNKLSDLATSIKELINKLNAIKKSIRDGVIRKYSTFKNIIDNAKGKNLLDTNEEEETLKELENIKKEALWCIDSLDEKCSLKYIRESLTNFYEKLCKKLAIKLKGEKGIIWAITVSKLHEKGGTLNIRNLIEEILADKELRKLGSIKMDEQKLRQTIRELVDDNLLGENISLW